jgi:hypothetical protein
MSNGATGPSRPAESADAKRRRWHDWWIAGVAGRLVVGRLVATPALDPGKVQRRLSPVYDFVSGFQPTPQGMAEVHRVLPFLALEIDRVPVQESDLIFPFSELRESELDGMANQIANADDLRQQQKAARSNIIIASPDKLPRLG